MKKRLVLLMSCFIFLFSSLAVNAEEVPQEDSGKNVEVMDSMELQSEITPGYYQVTGTGVRFREEPGLSGSIIAVLTKGEYLLYERVAGPTVDADGYTWLRCERYSTGEIGYIAINYITPSDPPPGAPQDIKNSCLVISDIIHMADEPGDSIVDIKANYHYKDATVSGETSNHYVGYKIKKSDITVVGTDLNGNEKEIVDFTYSPTVLKAGKNTVEVMYTIADDISVNDYIYVNGEVPTMINLDAKHKGGNIYLDTLLDSNDFIVKATYEDGTVKAITGCSISPSEVKEGKNKITITKDGLSDIVEITAIDRETITENESEPNNEIKNADEIDVNVKYSGMLKENGDVDYYRLRIDKKGKIVIKLTHPKIDKSGDYWIVSLLSQSDNERVDLRASGTDAETNSSPVRVTPGTYYVKVSQYNFSDEKYTMTVLFDEEDDSYESEPNDDLSNQAMNINLDQEYTGNLTNEKDVDYFKFSISEKRKVWIDFLHDKTSQGGTLWKIALLDDSDGAILTFDSTGENAKLTSDSVRLAPGNYYIRINDYYWSDMDYTFCVHSEQEGSDTENEDNGDYGTATVATIGSSIVGNLQSKNDVDFYRFDLSEAVTIKVIFTHNQIDSEEVFWRFELHSVESSEPIENDENQEIMKIKGNSSQDVISVWSSLPVGTYYLKIYDYNYNNDDYGITLSY